MTVNLHSTLALELGLLTYQKHFSLSNLSSFHQVDVICRIPTWITSFDHPHLWPFSQSLVIYKALKQSLSISRHVPSYMSSPSFLDIPEDSVVNVTSGFQSLPPRSSQCHSCILLYLLAWCKGKPQPPLISTKNPLTQVCVCSKMHWMFGLITQT